MEEAPLIIVGMHRSGTGILTEILRRMGVFMGVKRGVHEETLFFRRRNQYIYRLAHATWDNPEPMKYLIRHEGSRAKLAAVLKQEFNSMKALRDYWGLLGFLRSRVRPHRLWGWKDPRNTYTLPIWLDLFPQARIIHVYRNGIDVASSLRRRERNRKAKMHLLSYRCLELEGAFSLWAEYVSTCLKTVEAMPSDRAMAIQYEAFLTEPGHHISNMAAFLGLQLDGRTVADELASEIQPGRAFAFLNDSELRGFYEKKASHPLMARLGYHRMEGGTESPTTSVQA
jgi:hypothetical protein